MHSNKEPLRIGNAHAFWGDRTSAAAEMLAREPDLDYITLDYLAEVSMSILALQRERDSEAGFAQDFIDVVRSLAPYWASGGRCRLITNAGGLAPRACADACRRALEEEGCAGPKIGIVSGDDVLDRLRASGGASTAAFRNLDTDEPLVNVVDCLVTANAYLGAGPIAEALAKGADIVITGRVADPSLVVGPCIHRFDWGESDFERLAGATIAGHLIECGTQVTGGISTDWMDVSDVANIGFPVVEVSDDGSCVVTKPPGTGGAVTTATVKEQLVYEIGDPANYLSPDVSLSLLSITVNDLGQNRVEVRGAKGRRRPESYKVSATYRDGFRAAGTLTIIGHDAVAKARRCGELVLRRVREAGFELKCSVIECLGSGDAARMKRGTDSPPEVETVLRVAVEAESRAAVECFSRELMPFITAGPQGATGYAEGRPRVHPVFRYWPCLIAREAVKPQIEIVQGAAPKHAASKAVRPYAATSAPAASSPHVERFRNSTTSPSQRLFDIAIARSGDKGMNANIGVIARTTESWPIVRDLLTAQRVAEYFSHFSLDGVDRYELPNIGALNFILRGVLRNSLRTDAQGKALGQILLEMPLPEHVAKCCQLGPERK